MRILSFILRKTVRLNKTRRAFKLFGRDYILAVRTTKSNGYRKVAHKGLQGRRREFDAYHVGYVTLYRSVDSYTLSGDF